MQTKNQTQVIHLKCPPFLCQFLAQTWCKFAYLFNSKLWTSSLCLWCILFWMKLDLFTENLYLKKYLHPKHSGSTHSRSLHRLRERLRDRAQKGQTLTKKLILYQLHKLCWFKYYSSPPPPSNKRHEKVTHAYTLMTHEYTQCTWTANCNSLSLHSALCGKLLHEKRLYQPQVHIIYTCWQGKSDTVTEKETWKIPLPLPQ